MNYAQTNIQLFNQLHQAGYLSDRNAIEYVFNAYELTMSLFTSRFRGSGKAFIAHLVGTASILCSLRLPLEVVVAGLLHAAYDHGDFGDGKKGISEAKRQKVRAAIGSPAEEYIAKYTIQPWNEKTISAICQSHASLNTVERHMLAIRLANELEDHLDCNILYCNNVKQRQQYIDTCGHLLVKIAENLGFPVLATQLAQVLRESTVATIPEQLRRSSSNSFRLAPHSYQKRFSVALRQQLFSKLRSWRSAVRQIFAPVWYISRLSSADKSIS